MLLLILGWNGLSLLWLNRLGSLVALTSFLIVVVLVTWAFLVLAKASLTKVFEGLGGTGGGGLVLLINIFSLSGDIAIT